jgi:lysophospholipase L1-like esterase
MKVEPFPGIRTKRLKRVIEKRGQGSPDTVVIHVGTNDLRRTGNVDYVMGDIYDLVNMAKTKFSTSRVLLSGVLRRRDVSWRRIGTVKSRCEWVPKMLHVTF